MSKNNNKLPPENDPPLQPITTKPVKIEKVTQVEVIIGQKKIYCKVDYRPEKGATLEEIHKQTSEVYAIVRSLESMLNKLKKNNIQITFPTYEQHYNTTDIHSSHPGN